MKVEQATPELLDAAAARWVEAARPVRFRRATKQELDDVFRLRYRTVVEEGWARPKHFADGREYDRYDEGAIHIVGVDGSVLAATSRVVLPRGDRPLPTEAAFELSTPVTTGFVDIGRIVVAPGYRQNGHRILAGLLGRSWLALRSRGFDGFVGNASAAAIARYEELGIRLARIGPERPVWGEERFPIAMDVEATVASFAAQLGRQVTASAP